MRSSLFGERNGPDRNGNNTTKVYKFCQDNFKLSVPITFAVGRSTQTEWKATGSFSLFEGKQEKTRRTLKVCSSGERKKGGKVSHSGEWARGGEGDSSLIDESCLPDAQLVFAVVQIPRLLN